MSELALRLIAENKAAHERGEDATSLDLGNCGLTELPEELFECVWLEELIVSNNYWDFKTGDRVISSNHYLPNTITRLSTNILHLQKLRILRIEGNQDNIFNITDISILNSLQEIRELYLSYNKIDDITDFGSTFFHLKVLDLSNNQICSINKLSRIDSLECLFLIGNSIDNIVGIGKNKYLKYLYLDSNKITNLSGLEDLGELEFISATHNQINNLKPLYKINRLKILFISFNEINDLRGLRRLKNLKILTLNSNRLTTLNDITKLSDLEHIELSFNSISKVFNLKNLTKIKSIDISHNQIDEITGIINLHNLERLNCSNNLIRNIDSITNLPNLTHLDLSYNKIVNINGFRNISNLEALNLSNNRIRNLNFLSSLDNLLILQLSSNIIKECINLDKPEKLKFVTLSNNKIQSIEFLTKLKSVESIDIRENQIQSLSLNLIEKTTLYLDLKDDEVFNFPIGKLLIKCNPIKEPPIEVLQQGREFAIEYLRNKDKQPLNECKVIIVGRGGVGKTSLQKRLTHQFFDPNEQQTHGIRKVSWGDGVKAGDGKPIIVNFWDFGGQDIQQTLHQFFYSKNTLYILVLNKRHDEDPEDFLELVRTYGHNSPVLVVYNNPKDLSQTELLTYDIAPELDSSLRSKYPNIRRTFGLCCGQENDSGVNILRKYLQDYIPALDHVRETYPRSWLNIKHELLNKVKKNYIPFDDYEELCSTHQVEKQEIQKGLAEMLNTVGTVTYFDRPFIGNRYYILNPDWLTTGTYQIIDSKQTTKKRGRINLDDLRIIFAEKLLFTYRPSDYEFLLQLMKEFALCHYEPSREEWLIPSSLEGESKTNLVTFKEEAYRQYCVKFSVSLPSSVIHRFIARNIQHAHDGDYWRNGIVVKHPVSDTRMYVEADSREKEIRLWIKGENIRDCWEFFRKDIREFADKFEYQELVTLQKGVRVSYQHLMICKRKGKKEWFVPELEEDIDVHEALGLFENPDRETETINRRQPAKLTLTISGGVSEIISLLNQNNIYEAYEKIDELGLKGSMLSQLKEEFIGGNQGVNYIPRLKMCINELSRIS